jgi:insertion element IS1 protein InsB
VPLQISHGLAPPNARSISFLSREEIQNGFLLACQTEIRDNLEVWVPPESRLEEEQVFTTESIVCYDLPQDIPLGDSMQTPSLLYMPIIQKFFLSLPEPTILDNISDREPYENFVPKDLHIQSKAETFTVEGYNSLFRHLLARMRRKSKCYSKSKEMLKYSVTLLMLKWNYGLQAIL